MGEAKRRGDSAARAAAAGRRLTSLGATTYAVDRMNPQGLILVIDRSTTGDHVAKKLLELAPETLENAGVQIELWRKLQYFKFLVIFGIHGRKEGTYLQALGLDDVTQQLLPLCIARMRGQQLISAIIPGVADALVPVLLETVAALEGTIDPAATVSETLTKEDCGVVEPFQGDVDRIASWAEKLNHPASRPGHLFLVDPTYERLSDGWLRVSATYLDGTAAATCVPPTHWRVRGAMPEVAQREQQRPS